MDEARDTGGLGGLGHADGRLVVDVVGAARVEVAQRVVRDAGQVDDGVEALEVLGFDIADVEGQRLAVEHGRVEIAAAKEAVVEADDFVPCALEERDEYAADVAFMAGDEDFHGFV